MSLLLDALQQAAKQKQKQGAGEEHYLSPAVEHEIEEPDLIEVANEPLFPDDPAEQTGGAEPFVGVTEERPVEEPLELDLHFGDDDEAAEDSEPHFAAEPGTSAFAPAPNDRPSASQASARRPRGESDNGVERHTEAHSAPVESARHLWRDSAEGADAAPLEIEQPNRAVPVFEQPDAEKALEALILQSKHSRRSKVEHKLVIGILLASVAALAAVFYYAYRFAEAENNAVAWTQPQAPLAAPIAEPAEPALAAQTETSTPAGTTDASEPVLAKAAPVAATPPAYRNAKPKRSTPAPAFENELDGSVHIQRSTKKPDYRETIDSAYLAFKAGRTLEAKRMYRDVLARHPRNRDALLGLAVIAENSGDRDDAIHWFRKMLQLNAKDPYAVAALSQLENSRDRGDKVGEIKALLRENPDNAALHYSLGNLLAENENWTEAQQAYFKAFSLDKGNADYAFNLAVALDHMGKQDMALRYYEHAVQLANPGSSGFDLNAAQGRISSLRRGQGS